MSAQPITNGMRQPHAAIAPLLKLALAIRPMAAAHTTATCWLADCQLTTNPRFEGPAISDR